MPFELKPGQGTLHRVQDKQGNESRPDYWGELNIDGVVWRISGWIKLSPRGKWLSLSAEIPRPKAALETPLRKPAAPARTIDELDPDDEVPF